MQQSPSSGPSVGWVVGLVVGGVLAVIGGGVLLLLHHRQAAFEEALARMAEGGAATASSPSPPTAVAPSQEERERAAVASWPQDAATIQSDLATADAAEKKGEGFNASNALDSTRLLLAKYEGTSVAQSDQWLALNARLETARKVEARRRGGRGGMAGDDESSFQRMLADRYEGQRIDLTGYFVALGQTDGSWWINIAEAPGTQGPVVVCQVHEQPVGLHVDQRVSVHGLATGRILRLCSYSAE